MTYKETMPNNAHNGHSFACASLRRVCCRWWQLIIKDKVKNILLLLLILGYSSFGICQSELSVTPVFCQSWKEISNIEHDIELYRNGELITKEFYPINDFTAINLKKGKYLLKYKSIFDQEFQREINLDRRKKINRNLHR